MIYYVENMNLKLVFICNSRKLKFVILLIYILQFSNQY